MLSWPASIAIPVAGLPSHSSTSNDAVTAIPPYLALLSQLCLFPTPCRVTPHDGARFWGRHEAEQYDRVLLDAPCSSDRHVLQQAAARGGSSSGGNGSSGASSLSAIGISVPRSDW